jgi:hypothetical protein
MGLPSTIWNDKALKIAKRNALINPGGKLTLTAVVGISSVTTIHA